MTLYIIIRRVLVQVTWSQASSPVLERNITEVVPTSLRLNTVYIEVSAVRRHILQLWKYFAGLHQLAVPDISLSYPNHYPDHFQYSYL